ncbi:MAG: glycosyltransferase family 2 protein [Alphaproteobacteria bacterium]|nr:glycosyltransferase family 2 protein [Alphaproteobacteria bacterium]
MIFAHRKIFCALILLLLSVIIGSVAMFWPKTPAVSVVMAVYNCEKYLDQNITSVLTQNFSDFEFIIVNDASTDRSQEIIDKYAKQDKRIRAYKNKNNSGAAATRNEGLKHIRGKYTLVIDSDDALEPRALEISYKRAEKDNLDVFMFQPKGFDEKKQQFKDVMAFDNIFFNGLEEKYFAYPQFIDNLFQVTLLFAWNKFIRTDLIKNNNLHFAAHTYYDDSYFSVMALLKAKRVSYTEKKLYIYRFNREGSQTNKYSDEQKLYGKLELAKALRSEFKKMNVPVGAYRGMFRWMRDDNPNDNSEIKKNIEDFLYDTEKNYILKANSVSGEQ